jgi:ribosomal-protein-alanine N-acetyltransferase
MPKPQFWPVTLRWSIPAGEVRLRPLRREDEPAWNRLRSTNYNWLNKWEATSPTPNRKSIDFNGYIRQLDSHGKDGEQLPWAIEFNGELVGQITVASISMGSLRGGVIGYWISQSVAGRGIMPTAVALATDYCFTYRGLHRMEINIRTNNAPSLRVVEKLGFRDEGIREKYLHINGEWEDHRTFALVTSDVPEGLLSRLPKKKTGNLTP